MTFPASLDSPHLCPSESPESPVDEILQDDAWRALASAPGQAVPVLKNPEIILARFLELSLDDSFRNDGCLSLNSAERARARALELLGATPSMLTSHVPMLWQGRCRAALANRQPRNDFLALHFLKDFF
jgi:hypothetical protein